MFKKFKRLAAIGTLTSAMMFGIIIHDSTGTQPTDGGSRVNAGVIVRDATGTPPVVVASIIIHEANGVIIRDASDYPPGPYATDAA